MKMTSATTSLVCSYSIYYGKSSCPEKNCFRETTAAYATKRVYAEMLVEKISRIGRASYQALKWAVPHVALFSSDGQKTCGKGRKIEMF